MCVGLLGFILYPIGVCLVLYHILASGLSVLSVMYASCNGMFTQEHFSFQLMTSGMNIL